MQSGGETWSEKFSDFYGPSLQEEPVSRPSPFSPKCEIVPRSKPHAVLHRRNESSRVELYFRGYRDNCANANITILRRIRCSETAKTRMLADAPTKIISREDNSGNSPVKGFQSCRKYRRVAIRRKVQRRRAGRLNFRGSFLRHVARKTSTLSNIES